MENLRFRRVVNVFQWRFEKKRKGFAGLSARFFYALRRRWPGAHNAGGATGYAVAHPKRQKAKTGL